MRLAAASLALLVAGARASGDTTRTIALRYDAALAQADFPNPAARLTINGRTAWFLFDTGAGLHLLAAWFAHAAALEADASFGQEVSGVDSTGRTLPFRGLRDVAARLADGSELSLREAAVADFPGEFERFQIGGALSPQLLAGGAQAATLDLRVPELRIEPFEQAVRRLGARVVPSELVQRCGSVGDTLPNLLFAVSVSVGTRAGTLLLDSGAGTTTLVRQSALLRSVPLSTGGETVGLADKPERFRLAHGLDLALAGHEAKVDARVVEETRVRCGPDGLLGLDVLKACALVMGDTQLAIRCGKDSRP